MPPPNPHDRRNRRRLEKSRHDWVSGRVDRTNHEPGPLHAFTSSIFGKYHRYQSASSSVVPWGGHVDSDVWWKMSPCYHPISRDGCQRYGGKRRAIEKKNIQHTATQSESCPRVGSARLISKCVLGAKRAYCATCLKSIGSSLQGGKSASRWSVQDPFQVMD